MAKVVLKHVYKKYGRFEAIKDISFECQEGEFFFILGPSGAGKSTLLNLIAGTLPLTRGEIYIGDRLVNNDPPRIRDVAVAYEAYALYPNLNVYDNLAFPLRAPIRRQQYTRENIDKTVMNIAKILQIDDLLEKAPAQLSGGQKQRVALGRTLVRKPAAYLLDEPIAHLDAKLRHRMRVELKRLQRELRISSLFVTPDQLEAVSMAERIMVINHGELHQIGTPVELFNNPSNTFVATTVGDPKMNILHGVLKRKDRELAFYTGDIRFVVPQEMRSRLEKKIPEGGGVSLGIRPANITILTTKKGAAIASEINFIQIVGAYQVITLKLNNEEIKIKSILDKRFSIGEKVWLDINMNKTYFFEKDTGVAV